MDAAPDRPHTDKDCPLCRLEGVERSINVTVNPALLCYRHQPVTTAARDTM